jgi:transposase
VIDPETAATILRLARAEHWPVGTIASQLGVHHDVVERVLRQEGLLKTSVVRPSRIDPFLPFVRETWARHPRLAASRLYRMCVERGYKGSPDHFRHAVAPHRPPRPVEAFLRLRTLLGEQAQVDWAHFGRITIGRAQRPLVAFVMVLSFSRAIFLRFFLSMRTEDFLRGHQEAFGYFTGVPRVCLYDNLKSAVLERRGDAIRFNPLLLSFAGHYCYEPRPVAVCRGNEKARVERAIRYVREGFFLARRFSDVDDLNAQALAWCQGAALERPWPEDPSRRVAEVFREEQGKLLALAPNPFPVEERVEVSVDKTPYVRFDGNDYSVPHTLVRKTLVVLASETHVRLFFGTAQVACHVRSFDRGQQIEDPAHLAALVEEKRHARRHRGLDRLARAAPSSGVLLERLAERGQNLGQATLQLLRLLDTYGSSALERAVAEVLRRDVPHVPAVAQVLERQRAAAGQTPALPLTLPDDPRVRDLVVRPHPLENYDALAPAPSAPSSDPEKENPNNEKGDVDEPPNPDPASR